ncbi:glycosyltransferase [Nocardiopsis sp. HNM0947]|uniref:Glycosyltransferase n=1 Tax=Nocardiopsis coralli TaxID=2772213 RepID=A0ABR9PDW4_9ACTN|nr:glycosyltransferase [Nocardiopsis coralli]MBE3002016.1 glycosyltransferase [Nocardiopsis coralli]
MIRALFEEALRTREPGRAAVCVIGDVERPARAELPEGVALHDLDGRSVTDEHVQREVAGTGGRSGLTVVLAASPTDLRRAVAHLCGFRQTARLVVLVAAAAPHLDPPFPVLPGLGPWAELVDSRVRRAGDQGWAADLSFASPVHVSPVVGALVRGMIGGRRRRSLPALASVRGSDAGLWRPGDEHCSRTDHVDAVLDTTAAGYPLAEDAPPRIGRASLRHSSWERLGRPGVHAIARPAVDEVPPVDERVVNPIGFTRESEPLTGRLEDLDGRWALVVDGQTRWRVPDDGGVTDVHVAQARDLRAVEVEWGRHSGPLSSVRAVAALAAAGVPLVSGPVPSWATGLGDDLRARLCSVRTEDLDDEHVREEHSVRTRRAALHAHGALARWQRMGAGLGLCADTEPEVSVLLCTRRPEMVGFALRQVERQRGVRTETVLALHGFDQEIPEVAEAIRAFRASGRELIVHEPGPSMVFGNVLNRSASLASGHMIAKMDDDDWYGPDHLADLASARTYSGADLVGSSPEFFYLEALDTTVRLFGLSEVYKHHVTGCTLFLDQGVLEEIGGFRPLARSVDTQCLVGVRLAGGRIYRTQGCNFLVRRKGDGHTWTVGAGHFLRRAGTDQLPGWRPSPLLEPDPRDAPVTQVALPWGVPGPASALAGSVVEAG